MAKTGKKNGAQKAAKTGKRNVKAAKSISAAKKSNKAVKSTETIGKGSASAGVPLQLRANAISHLSVLTSSVAPLVLNDDASLLRALEKDGAEFYQAVDSEEDQTVSKALSDTTEIKVPGRLKMLASDPAAEPAGEATIYMVSNRPEYLRSSPTRFGVREVKVNTATRHIQIGQAEINSVPRVADENVLLFVHGFNNSTTDAALAAWRLGNKLEGINKTVFFSWPSKAKTLSYWEDYKIATESVPFVVECIKELASGRPGKVHIVAHSMGCRLLLMSLINYINTTSAVKLGQVYFIAGDVDQDVFLPSMTRLGSSKITTNLTNIAADNDKALKTSASILVHNKNRAGLYPPVVFHSHDPPAFLSLLRIYPGKGNTHSYYNAANVRADISNQVVLYHTTGVPKPADIRSTYRPHRGTKNTLVMHA